MAYRAAPLKSGISPAELLMGQKIRTKAPTLPTLHNPSWPYLVKYVPRKRRFSESQTKGEPLPDIPPGERFWRPVQKVEGTVAAMQRWHPKIRHSGDTEWPYAKKQQTPPEPSPSNSQSRFRCDVSYCNPSTYTRELLKLSSKLSVTINSSVQL